MADGPRIAQCCPTSSPKPRGTRGSRCPSTSPLCATASTWRFRSPTKGAACRPSGCSTPRDRNVPESSVSLATTWPRSTYAPKGLPRSFRVASAPPRHARRACATNPIQVRVRHEFDRPRAASVSQPESQPNAPRPDAPTKAVPDVHIDRKGRLSVKTADLATSDAFRNQLGDMVELAKTHPPKVAPSR